MLEGRLDTDTSADLEPVLLETAERFARLVLDLSEVPYLSSAGLRVLKKAFLAMQKKDGEMVLTEVPETIMDVFDVTGFSDFLKFE